jgi:hypothetical protein
MMYRDRIRVRPAGGRPSSNSHDDGVASHSVNRDSAGAFRARYNVGNSFASSMVRSHRSEASPSADDAPQMSGEVWRYFTRIAQLARETVGGVFGVFQGRPVSEEGLAATSNLSQHETSAFTDGVPLSSPAVPPNTPYCTAPAAAPLPPLSNFAQPKGERVRGGEPADPCTSGTIERRRPQRNYNDSYNPNLSMQFRDSQTAYPVEAVAAPPRAVAAFAPPVREAPQYQITVNQYFAAPERSPYAFAAPPELFAPRASAADVPGYRPRVSLLTIPSAVRAHAKRERPAMSDKAAKAAKAQPTASAAATMVSDVSLSNAPSAIPFGSPENSLTVPISTATRDKEKPMAGSAAAPATKAGEPASAPQAAPLFGAKAAGAAPTFIFGPKPASGTPDFTTATPFGGFGKTTAPSAVEPKGDDNNKNKDEDKKSASGATGTTAAGDANAGTAANPTFSFSNPARTTPSFTTLASTATVTTGGITTAAPAPSTNPLSFSPQPTEKTAGAPTANATTATPATNAAATKPNPFFKAGPPAVMPDDDGFASGADSDDDTNSFAKAGKAGNAAPAKSLAFSLNATGLKPAFGSASPPPTTTTTPPAPSSSCPSSPPAPFTFATTKPADTSSSPTSAPATSAAPAAPPSNSFFKAGPPAVIADDSGFASNAESDDDTDGKSNAQKTNINSTAPTTAGVFSFKPNVSAPSTTFGASATKFGATTGTNGPASPFTFGAASTSTAATPATPFKFGASPTASGFPSASPFGSTGASSLFGSSQGLNFSFANPK